MTLHRLRETGDPAFEELLGIYEDSFPLSERKSIDSLHRMMQAESYFFFAAMQNHCTVGFMILHIIDGGSAAFLEYMAVGAEERGRGAGKCMLATLTTHPDIGPVPLLLEVESDRTDDMERCQRLRRKQFYGAAGFREIDGLRWVMPQVGPGLPPPMEMLIRGAGGETLSKASLRSWLAEIYVRVYGEHPADPRLESMLWALPEAIRLKSLPLP